MIIGATKVAFEENEKRSIETGKFDDFIVLDDDIMEIAEDGIPYVTILSTYSEGKEMRIN